LELATARALEFLAADTQDEAKGLWSSLRPVLVPLAERAAGASASGARSRLEVQTKSGVRRLGFEIYGLEGERGGFIALIQRAAALDALETHLHQASRWQTLSHLQRAHVHGLRAPLNNIHLHLHLLLAELGGRASEPSELARRLEVIREESARLNQLIDTFFLQIRDGLEEERFDLRELVNEAAELLGPQVRAKRVTMATRLPRDEVLVAGRRDRLRHAGVSLLLHMLDAIPEGGELQIELEAERDEARIAIRESSGAGIPAEKLLDLLRGGAARSDEAAAAPVFGIGPLIARSFIQSDGGRVDVTPESGPDAAFVLVLPRVPDRRSAAPPAR
jgi:signal transduction histidine kinase